MTIRKTTIAPDNFSYEEIIEDEVVEIPLYQQMSIHGMIEIDGDLILNGTLVMRE